MTTNVEFPAAPLYWLAVGAFAVGTEGFMIAAILPRIAADPVGQSRRRRPGGDDLRSCLWAQFADSDHALRPLSGAARCLFPRCRRSRWPIWLPPPRRAIGRSSRREFFSLSRPVSTCRAPTPLPAPLSRRNAAGCAIAIVNSGLTIAVTLGVPLGAVDRKRARMADDLCRGCRALRPSPLSGSCSACRKVVGAADDDRQPQGTSRSCTFARRSAVAAGHDAVGRRRLHGLYLYRAVYEPPDRR